MGVKRGRGGLVSAWRHLIQCDGLSLALVLPRPGHSGRRSALAPESYPLLLPFDIRADREGWTVVEVETDRPASLDGIALVGLSLEDAETMVNSLNALELRFADLARRRVFDDLGTAWLYRPLSSRSNGDGGRA